MAVADDVKDHIHVFFQVKGFFIARELKKCFQIGLEIAYILNFFFKFYCSASHHIREVKASPPGNCATAAL